MPATGSDALDYQVAVLGGGISGVAALKCALEAGLSAVMIESRTVLGGLWAYDPNDYGAMSFTHINVSKENYCFSDFPFDESVPVYPRHDHMAAYVNKYAEHFDLGPHILFKTRVDSVTCLGDINDGKASKRWRVTITTTADDGTKTTKDLTVGGVMVCTGHHAKPVNPTWPGLDSFKGPVFHAVKFNNASDPVDMTNKKLLIIGIGNSACDIAVNATYNASKIMLSTRSGVRPVPNYLLGEPIDWYVSRALLMLPVKATYALFEKVINLIYGDPHKWGLRPKMRLWQAQPTVNSFLLTHIARGAIDIVGDIDHFDDKHVYFKDGTKQEVDVIIKATGYSMDLPFLDQEIRAKVLDEQAHVLKLFKNAFHEDIGPSMGFIGFVQPTSGGVLSVSEVQARYFCELFKGTCSLPDKATMRKITLKDTKEVLSRFHKSARHTIQVDPLRYADEVTSYFGADPPIWSSLITDPKLAWRLLLGTGSPASYRLRGPGAKKACRDIVRNTPVTALSNVFGIVCVILFPITIPLLLAYLFLLRKR